MSGFRIDRLPTPLARVAQRFQAVGPDSSADSFLLLSYLVEAAIKAIAIALHAGIRAGSPQSAYAIAYSLVRADGLGDWEEAIGRMSSHPLAGYLPSAFHQTLAWLTKRRSSGDSVGLSGVAPAVEMLRRSLGMDPLGDRNLQTVRHLIRELVLVRNKTKAHGAFGPDFFMEANPNYLQLVQILVDSSPLFSSDWLHLSVRLAKGNVRGVRLQGPSAVYMRDSEADEFRPSEPGIYVVPGQTRQAYWAGDLLRCNLECSDFQFPNGGYKSDGSAEFIDYATGRTFHVPLPSLSLPPAPLAASETEGLLELDIQSNVFGNLPAPPKNYVQRPQIQAELESRLLDHNHTIITLHGRGGIGKTWLALHVAHKISASTPAPFEAIVWFSARDVDLRAAGPAPVRPAVTDLAAVCRSYGILFDRSPTEDAFAEVLRSPDGTSGKGRLLIFDNFETLDDARGVHQFLDTHTHLPNKVLITSRERAFKADYPIEVRGMEFDEATSMLRINARELGIETLLTDDIVRSIYDSTEGHSYVMRVVLGEIAKEKQYVAPKALLPRRLDIVQAVFERSFNKLSDAGRWVFLLVGNWKSRVPELALLVVCSQRRLDVESGIEECQRLSLIEQEELADGQPCYRAPELARLFARKKLESDFDRLSIQEDRDILHRFGVISSSGSQGIAQPNVIERFLTWVHAEAKVDPSTAPRFDTLLLSVADLWPPAWNDLVDFRMAHGGDINNALRRLVEERPFDKSAWVKRANYAHSAGDEQTYIASLVSAVDADPRDVELMRETAYQLCRYVDAHKYEIPEARRGVYLAGLRAHMEAVANQLDATGLSRLAWLFVLEGNERKGIEYAQRGMQKDPSNDHCKRIIQRLRK